MKDTIRFWNPDEDPYGLFSNFADTKLVIDYNIYPTVEHYFQSMKTTDSVERRNIMMAATPKLAKELGRKARMKDNWEQIKDSVMFTALIAKAKQNRAFRELLISTNDAILVEASPFNRYWGCGRDGTGLNKLGELLMQVRDMLNAGTI